jgi:hypothetical protein
MGHAIIGEWQRPEKPPRCGSSLAHRGCKFADGHMDCSAPAPAYEACPYHQVGVTVSVYRDAGETP